MNINKVTPQILEQAKQMGHEAFAAGETGIPAHNKPLNDLMSSLALGIGEGGLEMMKAFINGWHDACDEMLLAAQDELVQITEIKAHGSELGELVDGMTFTSIAQADKVIVGLIKLMGMGFAKTKITVTWADGEEITTDSDYCEGETTRDSWNYMQKTNTSPLPDWLKRLGVTEAKHQARCDEWAEFVATHQLP